jgi:hypothetical protein
LEKTTSFQQSRNFILIPCEEESFWIVIRPKPAVQTRIGFGSPLDRTPTFKFGVFGFTTNADCFDGIVQDLLFETSQESCMCSSDKKDCRFSCSHFLDVQ